MSLIEKLPTTILGPKSPSKEFLTSLDRQSTLHNQSSVNGTPARFRNMEPSILDLNGEPSKKPEAYINNTPEGARI
jgi:hypothetical protein